MKQVQSQNNHSAKQTAITIGTFDGVHVGHQKIIKRLIEVAESKNLKATLLSFFPHPRMVLQKDANIKLINTIDEKAQLLKNLGLTNLIIKDFTKAFSRLSAQEFVTNILANELHAKYIIIGYDHQFGKNRTANIDDLKAFGKTFCFDVEEISAQDINEVSVSSTKIRNALNEGNIVKANAFLGYRFMLTGTVVKGKGLGKQLNFPTANIYVEEDYKLIPKQGAYIVSSIIDGELIYGMMNIGMNPTVAGKKESIEVHFFNFNKDLYDQKIQINLWHRIRDEQKFESIEALKKQLLKDKEIALKYIENHHA